MITDTETKHLSQRKGNNGVPLTYEYTITVTLLSKGKRFKRQIQMVKASVSRQSFFCDEMGRLDSPLQSGIYGSRFRTAFANSPVDSVWREV
jgi:hypothetical protein